MNFSLQILSQRLARGWTQLDLAKRTGIAQPNLAAFESGSRRPSLYTLSRLSLGLGIETGQLLNDQPAQILNRFAMDHLARALVAASARPAKLPPSLWRDLQAVYFSKLSSLAPRVKRRRPRLSPHAAERRVKSWLGPGAFDELTRRLDKFYPQEIK